MRRMLVCAISCLAWPAFAASELAQCLDIESHVARLDCYDRLARASITKEAPRAAEPVAEEPPPSAPDEPVELPLTGRDDREAVDGDRLSARFGHEQQREAAPQVEHLAARIESIRRAPLGQHIMTLSNGQVWMENEAGGRPIEPDQDIVIRKRRWHYELVMESQPNVSVRRLK